MKIPSFENVFTYDITKPHTSNNILFLNEYHKYCKFLNGTEDRIFDGKATVLIPCYKKANYIRKAVKSCVVQSPSVKTMVLLMDPDSQRLSSELSAMGDVECINSERLIVTKARTKLVEMCTTDWFVFLDADDELAPNFMEVLSKKKGAARFTGCRFYKDHETHAPLQNVNSNNITNIIAYNNTCLMHKDVFYDIGYDDSLAAGGEDTDFNLRLVGKKKWLLCYTTDTYYIYNVITENQLTKSKDFIDTHFKMFEKNLDILLEGLKGSWVRFKDIEKIKWLLENFTKENLYAFIDYYKYGDINLKVRFDRLCAHTYYSLLEESSGEGNPIILRGGRVKCFADLIYKGEGIDLDIKDPVERLFYALENYRCVESSDINDRDVNTVLNEHFFEYVEQFWLPESMKRYVNMWKTEQNMHSEGKDMQKVSFLLNKKCNANCPYCFQSRDEVSPDDDTLFKNFDDALTKFEQLTDHNVFPQILGGEPTLFSDYLINKILNRLKDYKCIYIFTNGLKEKSLWYEQENVVLNHHIINWQTGNVPKKKNGEFQSIVVCRNEISDLKESFADLDRGIIINPCLSKNPDYNVTYEERKQMWEIIKPYRPKDSLFSLYDLPLEKVQSMCRSAVGVWECNLNTRTVSTCCADMEKIPIEDFNGTEKPENCGECMNFGNML